MTQQFGVYDWLKLYISNSFICGALSGIASNLVVYPLEVARTRMAMQGLMAKHSLRDIIRLTYSREGLFSGFYKGGLTSLLGIVIYKGVGFTVYEFMKKLNKDRLSESLNSLHFSSGAVAGFVGQFVSYPIEVAKRRMQVAGSFTSDKPTTNSSKLV